MFLNTFNHESYVNTWISVIQTFKKELTRNWPNDMKLASDAFVDAQAEFARKAFKSTMDFNAGFNKAIVDGISSFNTVNSADKGAKK